jgi:membrane peptidoglycan carboxypeptidase
VPGGGVRGRLAGVPGAHARRFTRRAGGSGAGAGSTITQQYVKITTGRDQHTIWRKYREIIAAAKISQRYSKDQILRDYLNAIYLGRGAYGMPAAARAYFGVRADQLNLAQGALLAALIQAPTRLDPATNPAEARARWNYVLDGMVAEHWLAPARRASLEFPATLPPTRAAPPPRADRTPPRLTHDRHYLVRY